MVQDSRLVCREEKCWETLVQRYQRSKLPHKHELTMLH